MWYYRRNRWYRQRGPRHFWFFPLLFFVFVFLGGEGLHIFGFIIPVFVFLFILWLIRSMMSAGARSAMNKGQPYQQPYYQPPQQPYYQPPQQPYYRPYEQGYQPAPGASQEDGQRHHYPQPPYEQYEQPQAQYPQEMPPMEQ